jgi:hypothetical protein
VALRRSTCAGFRSKSFFKRIYSVRRSFAFLLLWFCNELGEISSQKLLQHLSCEHRVISLYRPPILSSFFVPGILWIESLSLRMRILGSGHAGKSFEEQK